GDVRPMGDAGNLLDHRLALAIHRLVLDYVALAAETVAVLEVRDLVAGEREREVERARYRLVICCHLGSPLSRLVSARRSPHSGGLAGLELELREAEDDELGRLDRRDTDLARDLAGLDEVGGVGLRVAFHVERLVRGGSE